ncbi:MAG: peptidoglycan recognition family protein [Clostridia bacterium]|nr:peptidoglycan recognition family protein [Clostridia bacterium]
MAILSPDKTVTTTNGLNIKQKIIPDSLRATKNVASWCKKGGKMKPCAKLCGTGKPKGITVHNTNDINTAAGTTAAEQYTRATYNGNMGGVVVHYYVYESDIWQLLDNSEQGWHATDGASRRKSQRGGSDTIGGNVDTIAIECIGNKATSEDTTAKLVAYLCAKHGLNPGTDVYTHKYFYPSKNCPAYILPHWSTFLANVKKYYDALTGEQKEKISAGDTVKITGNYTVQSVNSRNAVLSGIGAVSVKNLQLVSKAKKGIAVGSTVTIKSGAVYGGLSTTRGKAVPAAQLAPKVHTVSKIQTNKGVSEALLSDISSWVAVSGLTEV